MNKVNTNNLLLNTDSYKASHWLQYPPGTENVFSYIESRGGKYPATLFAGLQVLLKQWQGPVFDRGDIIEAAAFWKAHGEPFNEEGWNYILDTYNGCLPVRIRAVPEGSIIPTGNVLVTIEATDPKCFWLVSYLETALLRAVWYPTTVATQSWTIKQLIKGFLEKTGDVGGLGFKLHDFGARGVSSAESAGIGGMAHLINFMGTDTVAGVLYAMEYYNAPAVPAFSIPAAEHSTITSWGELNESKAYANMLKQYGKPGALLAVVSDSYDIYNAVRNIWGKELKQQVIDSGAIVVIRPDSGHPATVVTQIVRDLDRAFGSVVNSKGYKVLNNVRVIQGDGINKDSIKEILGWVTSAGYSADNVAFGMGGALLQGVNRDTQEFAMKCSAMKIDGIWKEVFKNPVTDSKKKSKKGRLTLLRGRDNLYMTVPLTPEGFVYSDGWTSEVLQTVFENGKLVKEWTFEEVRARSNEPVAVREEEKQAA